MEIIFELLFEIIGEALIQLLGEAILKPIWRATGRKVPARGWAIFAAGLALLGAGFFWGLHVADIGRTGPPRAMWVSIGLAVLLAVGALVRWWADRRADPLLVPDPVGAVASLAASSAGPIGQVRLSLVERVAPWRWSAARLAAFGATNATLAAGMALGHLAAS